MLERWVEEKLGFCECQTHIYRKDLPFGQADMLELEFLCRLVVGRSTTIRWGGKTLMHN
jgi:hypothetical protein